MELIGLFVLFFFGMIIFSFVVAIKLLNKNSDLQAKLQRLEFRLLKLETQIFNPVEAPVQETQAVREEKPASAPEIFPMEVPLPSPVVKNRTGAEGDADADHNTDAAAEGAQDSHRQT